MRQPHFHQHMHGWHGHKWGRWRRRGRDIDPLKAGPYFDAALDALLDVVDRARDAALDAIERVQRETDRWSASGGDDDADGYEETKRGSEDRRC